MISKKTNKKLTRKQRIQLVKALYRRLNEGKLARGDVLSADKAIFQDQSSFMLRIHKNAEEFENTFSDFADTYDIFRIFGKKDVILDVGAHWGYSALAMRRRGSDAKIFSIEAMSYNTKVLQVLKELEHGTYDYIENAATKTTEQLTFYIPTMNGVANTGSSTTGGTLSDHFAYVLADLAKVNLAPKGKPDRPQLVILQVEGRTIDDIVADQGFSSHVKAIKMDVERHEAAALIGAAKLIKKQKPLIMVEEANRIPEVAKLMDEYGYIHHERHNRKLVRHENYSAANDGFWLHKEKIDEYKKLGLL